MTATYSEERRQELDRFDLALTREDVFDVNEGHHQIDWSQFDEQICERPPVDFLHYWEREFARILDACDIPWRYKARTFAVEWDEEGNFVDSFTPDFYLPEYSLYLELVAPECGDSSAKSRKVRMLRQQYSTVNIELIYHTDYREIVGEIVGSGTANRRPATL